MYIEWHKNNTDSVSQKTVSKILQKFCEFFKYFSNYQVTNMTNSYFGKLATGKNITYLIRDNTTKDNDN